MTAAVGKRLINLFFRVSWDSVIKWKILIGKTETALRTKLKKGLYHFYLWAMRMNEGLFIHLDSCKIKIKSLRSEQDEINQILSTVSIANYLQSRNYYKNVYFWIMKSLSELSSKNVAINECQHYYETIHTSSAMCNITENEKKSEKSARTSWCIAALIGSCSSIWMKGVASHTRYFRTVLLSTSILT